MTHIILEILEQWKSDSMKEDDFAWKIIKKTDLGTYKKIKLSEYENKLDKITLKEKQKARLHKCFHDNKKSSQCIIIRENVDI